MRILVCGGRTWGYTPESNYKQKDMEKFAKACDYLLTLGPSCFISGGAKGADEIPKFIFSVPFNVYPADWKTYGKAAGPIRNAQMLEEGKPDLVVAFLGGSGTKDMVDKATKAGVKVIKVT